MSIIYLPFSYIMKFCVWIAQNSYLFGLFFFALVFQIVLFPLAIKQQKSQIARAKIQPKEIAIRERYAGRTDRVTMQKMNQEIQEMYQREGYNAFSGCLPLLIQLPLIFILFAIVRYPIQYSSFFTDAAETEIKSVVVASDAGYSSEEDFAAIYAQFSFNYAEDIRAHLVKDNDAAKEADEILTDKLGQLGELKTPEGEAEDAAYENGYKKYVLSREKTAAYRELGSVDIIGNYGDDYIARLKQEGALPEDYTSPYALYVEADGERQYYADMVPDFSFLGINLLLNPSFTGNKTWQDWILLLIPLLVFLTYFLNMKIARRFQPAPVGPDGKEMGGGLFMNVGMPLLSTVFSLQFPAAIGVYWIWRTLLSMVQPVILHKMYPIPVYSAEDIEAMKRDARSKQKKKKIITIEVDEDDDSYRDLEVKGQTRVESARPKEDGKKRSGGEELPYRKPTHIEMLSAEDDDEDAPTGEE